MHMPMRWNRCLALVVWTACTVAQAGPVTVAAGQSASFNFDLEGAGAVPLGPYDEIAINLGVPFGSLASGTQGHWWAFSDLNGTGTELDLETQGLGVFPPLSLAGVGFEDGIFSLRLSMTVGEITIDPRAVGITPGERTQPIEPLQVPEPASLALVGLALLALGTMRRAGSPRG